MKPSLILLFLAFLSIFTLNSFAEESATLDFFWGESCHACKMTKPYIDEIQERFPKLKINRYEVFNNQKNRKLFEERCKALGFVANGVPTLIIGDKYWVGSPPREEFENHIKKSLNKPTEKKTNLCIHAFVKEPCEECKNVIVYLKELKEKHNVALKKYNIDNPENKEIYNKLKNLYGLKVDVYPIAFIGNYVLIGENQIKEKADTEIKKCLDEGCNCPNKKIRNISNLPYDTSTLTFEEDQTLDLFGKKIKVDTLPILLTTVIISFLDGFNPCSLWLLFFLLGILILSKSRKKMLLVGLTFLLVTAAAYGTFVAGLFSVFSYVKYIKHISYLIAFIALVFGIVNIKDYFWFKKGISFTITDDQKTGIFKRMRGIMRPDSSTPEMIISTAIFSLGITLVELPCTAGLPLIWTNLLSSKGITGLNFFFLLLLYLLVYLSIEIIILISALITMTKFNFEEKHGKLLKLTSGVIMIYFGFNFAFNYDYVNSMTGLLHIILLCCISVL